MGNTQRRDSDPVQRALPAGIAWIWINGEITEQFTEFVVEQLYVATVNDAVVGIGMIDLNTGRLDAIMVRPDMMRHGIGKQMMSFLEDIGRAAG